MEHFELDTDFTPRGDQPQAIDTLCRNLEKGESDQVLLGVTGSGKTFTVANVIARVNRPALIVAPNKILAAQLYSEFKGLFPNNAVEYFVSYYDYYQPEAYLPTTDTYIEKDSSINDEIDKMRHSATRSLFTRPDVIVVASVSCIYGLGSPESYSSMHLHLQTGQEIAREDLLAHLIDIQYDRNDTDFHRGTFRVRGQVIEIFPAYEEATALRIEYFGDTIERIHSFDPLTGKTIYPLALTSIYPGSHYVVAKNRLKKAIEQIRIDLDRRLKELHQLNKLIEYQRLEQRTNFDLEMLEETGFCSGIENYSPYLDGREEGQPPFTLIDYFPDNFLVFIDESHITVPQLNGMYRGDRARKMNLVEYGFRLPSALDNRPLNFEEFNDRIGQTVYVSATPSDYELSRSGAIVEQLIRPTGLIDPTITVRPTQNQIDDLYREIIAQIDRGERVLVTTLTKRMAEDLTDYLLEMGIKSRYLHSDIDTLERIEIIRDLRARVFDVLVGINLLREGLDLPEVSLVAILDADKEGFLRSERSLIQTFGRAARNINGRVILYADRITEAMRKAIGETDRRRILQDRFNLDHGITPETVKKNLFTPWGELLERDHSKIPSLDEPKAVYLREDEFKRTITRLEKEMKKAAKNLEFEKAAALRDQIIEIKRGVLL